MGQASGGVEPLDQHLKGHVLVLVGGQAAPAHLGQQLGETGISGQIDPQHQGVDEKPHQLIQCGVAAARRSGTPPPHRNCALSSSQQHRQSGLHHHETGRVVLAGHPRNLLLQPRRPVHRHTGAARNQPPADRADRWAAASRSGIPARACSQ